MHHTPDAKGELLADRYELVELAGQGGMATVWRAVQHGAAGFSRPVGIKRLRPELMGQREFVSMFIEEARVCAELVHPNVVQVYDFGYDAGGYFLVMEWVEGVSLAHYLESYLRKQEFAPWTLVTAIGIEALRALSAAHVRIDRNGDPAPVYHRDVSPANILLGLYGIVKLSDFGLARAMDRARTTAPDIVKGKVGYLAPEMLESAHPTPQSDIYALGVVLWQALAGRRLFVGDNDIDIFLEARRADIPPVVEFRNDLPQELTATVERALARDPDDRFRSARQMGRVLANLLRTVSVPTDAKVLAQSVAAARVEMAFARSQQAEESHGVHTE
ncbi:MAG: serine/threonine protein kinase [Myxococcales bacterium]|nr:serine/threonine protein kinase [Myxococcales bacterium]